MTLLHGIPQIKRFMAGDDAAIPAGPAPDNGTSAERVIVIGAGAAGLAAALHLQVYFQAPTMYLPNGQPTATWWL